MANAICESESRMTLFSHQCSLCWALSLTVRCYSLHISTTTNSMAPAKAHARRIVDTRPSSQSVTSEISGVRDTDTARTDSPCDSHGYTRTEFPLRQDKHSHRAPCPSANTYYTRHRIACGGNAACSTMSVGHTCPLPCDACMAIGRTRSHSRPVAAT